MTKRPAAGRTAPRARRSKRVAAADFKAKWARNALRVSPASFFELTALHTLARLRLTRTPEQWIRESLDATGLRAAELSAAIAIEAGGIPRAALADPLDRLLVATARELEATFLTSDAQILDYCSKAGDVRVQNAIV